MNSSAQKAQSADRTGLSSLTFWIKSAQAPGIQPWRMGASQPAKLLVLSLLIMSCLFASLIYYGALNTPPSLSQHTLAPK